MKKLPAHLPPLPDGAVYLGWCGGVKTKTGEVERISGFFILNGEEWCPGNWNIGGGTLNGHFAAPADSEIARLNGCGKPSWDDAPEGATHLAQHDDGGWVWFIGCEWRDPKPTHCGGWEFYGCGPQEVLDCEFVENGCQPNPNWRDTLERRPDDGLMSIREFMVQSHPDYSETPDLIIPKDVALYADAQSILNTARANDYRIEWDSNGIRGWKE